MRCRPILLLAFLATALFGVSPALAADGNPVSGKAVFTLGTGKAGKALNKQRVTVTRLAPATLKRLSNKRVRVTLSPAGVRISPGLVDLTGGITFRRGKRKIAVRSLKVKAVGKVTVVTANLGGKRIGMFHSARKLQVGRSWQELKWHAVANLDNSRLSLTPAAARILKKRLKLKRVAAGPVGQLKLNADRLDQPVAPPPLDLGDPYFAQCGITATAIGAGNFPPAAALPTLADPEQIQAESPNFDWGLKEGLRSYLKMFQGSMHALDGATLVGADGTGSLKPVLFSFPVTGGEYSTANNKGFVNMSGTGVLCNPEHGFRVAFSNPTVVVDGANSRIDADVDFNKFGTWVKTQRTAIATLDPAGITPTVSGNGAEITWTGIPAKFTDAGAMPFCAEGGPPGTPNVCIYKGPSGKAGATPIDPITITFKVPGDG